MLPKGEPQRSLRKKVKVNALRGREENPLIQEETDVRRTRESPDTMKEKRYSHFSVRSVFLERGFRGKKLPRCEERKQRI